MKNRARLAVLAGVSVAAVVVVAGGASRVVAHQKLTAWTADQAIPTVGLAAVQAGDAGDLQLPGQIQAFNTAPIRPRVSGYVRRWYVDIGTEVKAGQVLADIDTPDLDAQFSQAKADLGTATANQKLAATTAQRWTELLAQDAVSKQDEDDKAGDLAAKQATMNSARANLDRLQALESFKKIVAPFDGLVTTRNADIGQLVSAGDPTTPPLFTVADEQRLRIYVQVPQAYTALIQPGMTATLSVPEYPGRLFRARVVSTSTAVNTTTGALTAELWYDNPDHVLKPGDYAQVTFDLPAPPGTVRVPASALLSRHYGLAVAVVGPNHRVQIRRLDVVRDLGSAVVVAGGLSPGEPVIDNPADTLQQGDEVRVARPAAEAPRNGTPPRA
jgi:RND family efflux transporter MFP subunit